jgi:hypothetical protein
MARSSAITAADLFVNGRLIIELKAAKALADEHVAQILGYLRASRVEHGLLINFGAPKFEIKKYALSQPGQGVAASSLRSALVCFLASFAPFRGSFLGAFQCAPGSAPSQFSLHYGVKVAQAGRWRGISALKSPRLIH